MPKHFVKWRLQPASCSLYLFLADKTQTKLRSVKVRKLSTTYENMTIAACFLVVVLLPCRADSDNTQICEIYKNTREYDDFSILIACVLLALACSWPALYGVRLASIWLACFAGVVFSARLSCSVWPAPGSLSWTCVVWVWPAVLGPRPKHRLFLIEPLEA